MRTRRRTALALEFLAAALVAVLALSLAPPARADRLGELKASGQIGERADGYLGVVAPEASDEIRRFVDSINEKRAVEYQAIAKKRGTTAAVVSALAGEKLVEREPPGHYVMDAEGNWARKP